MSQNKQYTYWLLTIPEDDWNVPEELPAGICYIRGQVEEGGTTRYRHWQLLVVATRGVRRNWIKERFGGNSCHAEPSRSDAADSYVWKEDTRVAGTQFELGTKRVRRNSPLDWDSIRESAKGGRLESIPADIYVRCYSQLRKIAVDHLRPVGIEREAVVFWGSTGLGKSRRAWFEAGEDAYPKGNL